MRRAFAEIDLNQLASNLRQVRKLISPATKIMGIVKADAYGHGAVEVSELLVSQGVEYLGVAWESEAMQLRQAGIKAPILILSEPVRNVVEDIISLDVSQTVYTLPFARALSAASEKNNKKVKVHVKIDTGMGRIGVQPNEAVQLMASLYQLPGIELEGIFTHFAKADEKEEKENFTYQQLHKFNKVIEDLKKEGIKIPPLKHAANSAAIQNYPETHLDMVRAGLMLYDNVLTFKTHVAYLKKVKAGTPISYGSTYITDKESLIATISAGYADGWSRALSNKGRVLISGQEASIIGRICMDMFMVDVTNIPNVNNGDEVVLLGKQNGAEITMQEINELTNTIAYEVMCGIGKRVPRVYK
ncbi:MAG: alanine racemase [Candidatus Margulisbacteria bacterium]|nr:alanine racemase [Candidatus Margulisiibacteriota bacterium]